MDRHLSPYVSILRLSSIFLFVYVPMCPFICLSVYLFLCLFVYLSTFFFVIQFIYLFLYLSTYLFVDRPLYLSFNLCIYFSVYVSVYLSIVIAVKNLTSQEKIFSGSCGRILSKFENKLTKGWHSWRKKDYLLSNLSKQFVPQALLSGFMLLGVEPEKPSVDAWACKHGKSF